MPVSSAWISTCNIISAARRFRSIAIASLGVALLLALGIGYGVAVYHSVIGRRIQELHDSSIHDSLTGMLNRRGAMQIIKKSLERHAGSGAMLLVDIDNLKMINECVGIRPAMRSSPERPTPSARAFAQAMSVPGSATSS